MEVSTVKFLEILHSYMRKWKMPQSLSCLTENVIANFNSVTQTMMPDKIIICISKYWILCIKEHNDSAKHIVSKIRQNVH